MLAVGGVCKALSSNPAKESSPARQKSTATAEEKRLDLGKALEMAEQVPYKPKYPNYQEWASKIKLPEVKLPTEGSALSPEEVKKHFIPEEMDDKEIGAFYVKFDKRWAAFRERKGGSSDTFVHGMIDEYRKLTDSKESTDELIKSRLPVDQIGRLLIPHGYWLDATMAADINRYTVGKVDKVQMLTASHGDKSLDIPLVSVSDNQYAGGDLNNKKENNIHGRYIPNGNFLVIHPERSRDTARTLFPVIQKRHEMFGSRGVKPCLRKSTEDFQNATVYHEAMHAVLENLMGIDTTSSNAIKRHREIPMGHYGIKETDLRYEHNAQFHELVASAYGMKYSGSAAFFQVISVVHSSRLTYAFANAAQNFEVMYHPKTDRLKVLTAILTLKQNNDPTQYMDLVLSLPDKDFHEMGERLAKMGLYITQPDKK